MVTIIPGGVKSLLRGVEKNANTRLYNVLDILYNTFHGKYSPIFAISPSFSAGEYIRQNELKCLKLSFVNNSV